MAGEWKFTASNNGTEVAPGIYSAGTDEFTFTATVANDGQSLNCHAGCLYKSKQNIEYPADWQLLIEENNGQHRIGWVLSNEQPAFTKEFDEPKDSYLENGFWYWGSGTEEHHYIYLLTDNEDASAYAAPVFWSGWTSTEGGVYSLSSAEYNSQKLYAIVAAAIPYGSSIGYAEIWSSVKLQKTTGSGIASITADEEESRVIYNLQGARLNSLQRGLNIVNGRKFVAK